MPEPYKTDLERLHELLLTLEGVLESYQMDARATGIDGFCEGRIYRNALPKCQEAIAIVERLRE